MPHIGMMNWFLTSSPAPGSDFALFSTQPSDTSSGSPISPAVVVTVYSAPAVVDTGFTGNVTISMLTDGATCGTSTLSGTLVVAAVAGVATFSDLSLDNTGVGYVLRAGFDADIVSVTSNPFVSVGVGRPAVIIASSQYRVSPVPGIALTGNCGVAFVWWRCDDGPTITASSGHTGIEWEMASGALAEIYGPLAPPDDGIGGTGATPAPNDGLWHVDCLSWDVTGNKPQWFRDGSDVGSPTTITTTAGPVKFPAGKSIIIAGNPAHELATIFIGFSATFFDLGNPTNMAKIRTIGGSAVSISGDGSSVTGMQPIVFLQGDTGDAASWLNNRGSLGGTFTYGNLGAAELVDAPDGPF